MSTRRREPTESPAEEALGFASGEGGLAAAFEPALQALRATCAGRCPTLADAEAAAASLPAALGDEGLARLPCVGQFRELVARYVREQHHAEEVGGSVLSLSTGSGVGVEAEERDAAKALVAAPEWQRVLQQCRDVLVAQGGLLDRRSVTGAVAAGRDAVDILNLDGMEGSLLREWGGAEVLALDDCNGLLDARHDAVGPGWADPSLSPDERALDPALNFAACVRAFASQQGDRLRDVVPISLASPSADLTSTFVSMHSAGNTEGSASPGSAATAFLHSSEDFLTFLGDTLDRHPDVVFQYDEWRTLVRLLVLAVDEDTDDAVDAADRYFAGAGARQRLLLVEGFVQLIKRGSENGDCHASALTKTLVATVLKFAAELPSDWVSLLDAELGALLTALLRHVVLPHVSLCSAEDPLAAWLARWCERPSIGAVVQQLTQTAPVLVRHLQDLLPCPAETRPLDVTGPHAICAVAYLLPFLSVRDDGDDVVALLVKRLSAYVVLEDFPRKWRSTVGPRLTGVLRLVVHTLPTVSWLDLCDQCSRAFAAAVKKVRRERRRSPHNNAARSALWLVHVADCLLLSSRAPFPPGTSPGSSTSGVALRDVLRSLYCSTERLRKAYPHSGDGDTMAERILPLWRAVLPRYGVDSEPTVTEHVIPAARRGDAFATTLLVSATASADLWLTVRSVLAEQGEAQTVKYGIVLDAIVQLHPTEGADAACCNGPILSMGSCALLLRWCTLPVARTGLRHAVREKLAAIEDPVFYCPEAVAADSPLLLPAELLCGQDDDDNGVDSAAPVALELPPSTRRELFLVARYQCVGLLLGTAHVSPNEPGTTTGDEELFVAQVMGQVRRVYLTPASDSTTSFGDDSLVVLLSAAALSVLVSRDAEEWMWRGGGSASAVQQQQQEELLRELRSLCTARRGVDPVYFLVRFLTSGGKGKRRLASIFLHGFAADLHVEATLAVDAFVDGEEYPRPVLTPRSGGAVAARAAGSTNSSGIVSSDDTWGVLTAAFEKSEALTAALPTLSELVRMVQLAHATADAADVVRVMQRRTLEEWLAFGDTGKRAEAVTRNVLALSRTASIDLPTALTNMGMDLHFISCVCVANWLRAPPLEKGASGSAMKASLREFTKRGLASWEGVVARSLFTFIRSTLYGEDADDGNGGFSTSINQTLPVTAPSPFPSPLMIALLLRPFTLERK